MRIINHLGRILLKKNMTLLELSKRTGISYPKMSLLRNNGGEALLFTTLAALCEALDCQPGELLECITDEEFSEQTKGMKNWLFNPDDVFED